MNVLRYFLFVFLLIVLAVAEAPAVVYETDGGVEEATVYRDRAQVTKGVERTLDAGDHRLRVSLPSGIDEDSLRVYSDDATTINTFRVETEHRPTVTDTRIRELKSSIEELERKKKYQEGVVDANQQRLSFLGNLRTSYNDKLAKEQLARSFSGEEMGEFTGFLVDEHTASREAIIEANRRIEDLRDRIESLRRRLEEGRGRSGKTIRTGVVEVTRPEAGAARLELVYNVPNAGWKPAYDFRVQPDRDRLSLSLYGTVRQNTGERWEDVDLKLSTGRPGGGAQLSEPEPQYLEPPEQPQPRRKSRLQQSDAAVAESLSYQSSGSRRSPETADEPNVGPNVTFPTRQVSSLPGDGTSRRVQLLREDLAAELSHRAAPLVTGDVYLWLEAKNELGYPLPAGPTEVYVDGAYVGELDRGTVLAGDTITTSAGVDQRLSASHEQVVQFRDSTFWSDNARVKLSYELTLTNGRSDTTDVTVIDRVPVSRHEDIEVEVTELAEPNRRRDNGLVHWDREVPGNEEVTLDLTYTVTVPQKWSSILPGGTE